RRLRSGRGGAENSLDVRELARCWARRRSRANAPGTRLDSGPNSAILMSVIPIRAVCFDAADPGASEAPTVAAHPLDHLARGAAALTEATGARIFVPAGDAVRLVGSTIPAEARPEERAT